LLAVGVLVIFLHCTNLVTADAKETRAIPLTTTAGTSPTLAAPICRRIERAAPAAFGTLAAFAGAMRRIVRARLPDVAERGSFWRGVLTGRVATLVFAGRATEAAAELYRALPSPARRNGTPASPAA